MTSPLLPTSNSAITAIGSIDGTQSRRAVGGDADAAASGAAGSDFAASIGEMVGNGIAEVGAMENAVDAASRQAAVGNLESVSDFMIATSEAQLATEITVAVRDRAITAFNDIMRMQV